MSKDEKERLTYIDIAKFIGIFILLVEHTGNWTELTGHYLYLKKWICSFHMPLFFIVLGIVISQRKSKDWKCFIKTIEKRIKSIIIPYVIWCFVYANGFGENFFLGMLYGTNPSLGTAGTNQVLWFLPVMFVSMVLYQIIIDVDCLIIKENSKKWNVLLGAEAVILTTASILAKSTRGSLGWVWGIDIAFMGCAFILYGVLAKKVLAVVLTKKWLVWCLLGLLLTGGIVIALNNAPYENWVTIMALAMYGRNIPLFVIGALANTLAMVLIGFLLKKIRILAWLGENSLFIMAVHYILFHIQSKSRLLCWQDIMY